MSDEKTITVKVKQCSRCGQDHADLTFDRLDIPCDKYTHWADCPVTRQPILLRILHKPAK